MNDEVSPYWAKRAEAFHKANPHVYGILVARALEACGRKRKVGIELLWNVLRWDLAVRTSEVAPKLNQNFKAWYARKIMAEVPTLDGFFETRVRQRAESRG